MAVDTRMREATRRAIYRASGGLLVTFSRVNGVAPNANTTRATVKAQVRNYKMDTREIGQEGFKPLTPGAITQGDREILVMADDLAAAGFPLPVEKGDKIEAQNGEKMHVVSTDALKRAVAGCIEIIAAGV